MNLACLLMTLVCLLTILLFSTGQRTTAGPAPGRANGETPVSALESIDSLDRQPFVGGADRRLPPSEQDEDGEANTTDGFNIHSDGAGKVKRTHSDHPPGRQLSSSGEREVEETTGSPPEETSTQKAGSIIEPILSRLFDDLDGSSSSSPPPSAGLGGLLKALTKAVNSTGKPVVRRNKNGATIIISSAGPFPGSNWTLNDTSLPSLLDRLLPPMLRPLVAGPLMAAGPSTMMMRSSRPSGFATITINSEPLPSSPFGGAPFDPLAAALLSRAPFGAPHHHHLLSSSPLVMASSSSSSSLMPPPGLLNMILRSAGEPQEPDTEIIQAAKAPSASSSRDRDALSAQASQMNSNQTKALNSTSTPSSSASNATIDGDVELLDVGQLPTMINRSARRPAGSMILISSSSSSALPTLSSALDDPLALPFGPRSFPVTFSPGAGFVPPFAPPPMLLMGANSGAHEPAQMSPILRAILSNVLADLGGQSAAAEERNKSDLLARRDAWPQAPGVADQAAADDDWDEPSRRLRARHRADSLAEDSAAEQELVGQEHSNPMDHPGSLIEHLFNNDRPLTASGTIRQTFRRPGMTVERIIQLPDQHRNLGAVAHQVGLGVRSQSISRADESDSIGSEQLASRALFGPPRLPSFSRLMHPDGDGPSSMMLPPIGLIGKLLGDLRQSEPSGGRFAVDSSRASSRMSSEEDLDEGDSRLSDEATVPKDGPGHWSPRIRVASARIRLSPRRESIFVPPAHFSFPASSNDEDEADEDDKPQASIDRIDERPAANLEDTLNSVEAGFNQVLSMAQGDRERSKLEEPAKAAAESPFTSPSSPLFGFPATAASDPSNGQPADKSPAGSNRRQRAFIYHSNLELAANLAAQGRSSELQKRSSAPKSAESPSGNNLNSGLDSETIERGAQFGAPSMLPPPAAVVMGRRLDDGPFAMDQSAHSDSDLVGEGRPEQSSSEQRHRK